MTRPAGVAIAAAVAVAVLASACGGADGSSGRSELVVLAASSLTEAFDALEQTYESQNPDVDLVLSYDSSATLAAQVVEGAPADVLATADTITMQGVVDAGLAQDEPVVFASNTLVVVTPADDPAGIDALEDLADPGVRFAACVDTAPCGAAASRLLELSGVSATPISAEDNVKGVLTKVTAGEVDAGLVYATDAQAAGDQVQVVVPGRAAEVVTLDPIVVLTSSDQPEAAQAWVDLVLSPEGQQVLAEGGFGPVP